VLVVGETKRRLVVQMAKCFDSLETGSHQEKVKEKGEQLEEHVQR
jgi:hypothetical protein